MLHDQHYKVKPLVICTKQYYGAVLLDVETKYCYQINQYSLHIWNGYCNNLNVKQIVDSLMASYAMDEKKAFDNITQFTQQMEEEGLLITV